MEFLDYEGLALFKELNDLELAKKQDKITSFAVEKKEGKEFIILKSGDEVVGEIDATEFVTDGMLESVSLVTTGDGHEGEPTVPYIKMVFNAAAGDKVIELSVKDLVDTYEGGNGIVVSNNIVEIDTEVVSTVGHTHTINDVVNLQEGLDAKVNKDDLDVILIEKIYNLFGKKVAVVDTPEALVEAIEKGGNVCLLENITLDSSIEVAKDDSTINLNGKTLTVGGTWGIKVTGQNVEISNGTIAVNEHNPADANDRAIRVEGGSVKVESVAFTSELDSFVAVQGTKNVGGSVAISNCVIDAPNIEAFAITQNGTYGGTDWSIKDTVINAPNCNGAIYISNTKTAAKQNVVIENCEINAKGCIEVKHTNLTVNDCKLSATDTQSYVDNGNGNCTTGYDIAITKNTKDDDISGVVTLYNNSYSCVEGGKDIYIHADGTPVGYTLDTLSVKYKD